MCWLVLFLTLSSVAFGQKRIEGTVVDKESGKPIPFASLAIVGTQHGTSSNLEGQFSLVVPDTSSVKVTCVGYETLVINTDDDTQIIKLKPVAIQLKEVLVYNKNINASKIVRKAFTNIEKNYDTESFLQKFFYRHYSKIGAVYERLTEASVDVWKHNGYQSKRKSAGEKEEMRITQLRRSLDIKGMIQEQKPLWLGNILQTDMVGYQTKLKSTRVSLSENTSNLKTDFLNYIFTFDGITTYDDQEVYKINYEHKKDSVLTTAGYRALPQSSGSLYITTDTYAFVKTEDTKHDEVNTIHSSAYYRKYGDKYYPYHLLREGENNFIDYRSQSFHIELMSVEIRHGETEKFTGREPGRAELLAMPYDSTFWSVTPILKTTPLEVDIISDLGGGISLNKQFYLYRQYELNVTDGGKNAEDKFNWLREDSRGKRILYICFWDNDFKRYLLDIEYMKQLKIIYNDQVTFVFISLEDDEARWQQLLAENNFFSDGMINYRVGSNSEITREFKIKGAPAFVLISKTGEVNVNAKQPTDPLLQADLKHLIERDY